MDCAGNRFGRRSCGFAANHRVLVSRIQHLASGLNQATQLSTTNDRLFRLLNYFFKLRTKDTPVVAIKRDMKPIPFLTSHDEFRRVGKIWCPRSVISRLRDYVDHQVPGPLLTYFCQRASNRLLFFVRSCENRDCCGDCPCQPGNMASVQRRTVARRLLNYRLPCGEGIWLGN